MNWISLRNSREHIENERFLAGDVNGGRHVDGRTVNAKEKKLYRGKKGRKVGKSLSTPVLL